MKRVRRSFRAALVNALLATGVASHGARADPAAPSASAEKIATATQEVALINLEKARVLYGEARAMAERGSLDWQKATLGEATCTWHIVPILRENADKAALLFDELIKLGKVPSAHLKLDEADVSKTARNGRSESDGGDKSALGISVAPLTPETASRLGAPRNAHGLVVEDVDPDGRAADSGIQQGDIIEQVNRQPVQTVEELRAAVRRAGDRPVLLLVNRGGNEIYVTVRS